jgi:hypothetical protein
MILLKQRHLTFLASCLITVYITGCEFDNPYVPDSASSSTLTGRIVTDPAIDLTGAEVLLRGQDSFAAVTHTDGRFLFQDILPGDYSLQVQKKPYLQHTFPVSVRKSMDENIGDVNIQLKGAIAGTIPNDKIAIIHGEVEVVVYIDGVPLVPQEDNAGKFTIDLSSTESVISIHAETKITVYVDNAPYSATVQDEGAFIAEFIPPGIYNDIRVKLNSEENALPIVSGGPVVVKSGQTRFLAPTS